MKKGESSDPDLLRLIQELQVHQAELEIQNEELRRVQKELEVSQNQYHDLYDSAPIGFVTINRNGLCTRINRAAEDMLAGPDELLIGTAFSRWIHPEDFSLYSFSLKEAAGSGNRHICEVRLFGKDGIILYVRIKAGADFDEAGNLIEWRLVLSDITESKRAEEALRNTLTEAAEGRRVLEAMMEHIPIGITIADAPDVKIRTVSRYGRELTGKSKQQIEGIPVDQHAERWQIYDADGITQAKNETLPLTAR